MTPARDAWPGRGQRMRAAHGPGHSRDIKLSFLVVVVALPWLGPAVSALEVAVRSDVGSWNGTDYPTKVKVDSDPYERCKATNRCNRAMTQYVIDEGRYLFQKQRFRGGRPENADLFLNFEDWMAGTLGLGVDHVRGSGFCCADQEGVVCIEDALRRYRVSVVTSCTSLPLLPPLFQAYLLGYNEKTKGAHFNSFDYRNSFPLLPSADDLALAQATPGYTREFDYHLVFNSSDIKLAFNTTYPPTLVITNTTCAAAKTVQPTAYINTTCTFTVPGFQRLTDKGTQVGLFNFRSIYLGPTVNVTVAGNRAMVLVSRSTVILDTKIVVQPGTLGVRVQIAGYWLTTYECFVSASAVNLLIEHDCAGRPRGHQGPHRVQQ